MTEATPRPWACASCKFWASPDEITNNHLGLDNDGVGECRARAPSGIFGYGMIGNDGKMIAMIRQFAPTPPTDWCAEHQPVVRAVNTYDEREALLREAADGLTDWCNGREIDHASAISLIARIRKALGETE